MRAHHEVDQTAAANRRTHGGQEIGVQSPACVPCGCRMGATATIRNQQAKIMALSQQQLSPGGQPAVQSPAYRLKQEILTLRRHETELQQQLAAAEHALLEITTMYVALAC